MSKSAIRGLRELARLCGVQTEYQDVSGKRRRATPEALLQALQAFKLPTEHPRDIAPILRERRLARWNTPVEAVTVAWNDEASHVELRLPLSAAHGALSCHLVLESRESLRWEEQLDALPQVTSEEHDGTRYLVKRIALPDRLPLGYHQLQLAWGASRAETMVISAPRKVFSPANDGKRSWGVFLPLYALHSERSWGAGDFTDLERFSEWVGQQGGHLVATLPLLASFVDQPNGFSPYAPASRLYWNEFYLDVTAVPELAACEEARAMLNSTEVQREIASLRAERFVDYSRQMALKRKILGALATWFFEHAPPRRNQFQAYVQEHPEADDYATFRALRERLGTPWTQWPEPWRGGDLAGAKYNDDVRQYHLYVQWLADEQLQSLSHEARDKGSTWYLDLPLGTSADGYDVWRNRDSFALGARGGAPPDAVFTKGQNWGFPPLHPQGLRQHNYAYLIATLRHHLRYASLLRIDHVMCLHRLFWVPEGLEATDGVYVRYPAEELYAILAVESHRYRAAIVGENLGTVPRYVNAALKRHGVHTMFVVQYELKAGEEQPLQSVPRGAVASFNTHDLPTFTAFLQGLDIDDRLDLGLLDEETARREHAERREILAALTRHLRTKGYLPDDASEQADPAALTLAALEQLGDSPARVVLVNLEDLWFETAGQNVPGTVDERPNWRRRARYSLEEFAAMPFVQQALSHLNERRLAAQATSRTRLKAAESKRRASTQGE